MSGNSKVFTTGVNFAAFTMPLLLAKNIKTVLVRRIAKLEV